MFTYIEYIYPEMAEHNIKKYIKYNHSVALLGRYWLIVIDDRELCVVMFICFVGSFFFSYVWNTIAYIWVTPNPTTEPFITYNAQR